MTLLACGTSGARCAAGSAKRGARWSCSASMKGVSSIEIATASVMAGAASVPMPPWPAAAPISTKANSPPCASSRMKSGRSARGMPAVRAMTQSTAPLMSNRPAIRPKTAYGLVMSTAKSTLMPTAMKNSPSSRPLNGSTAASISWRYSDSASSTPPRKAPSAIDRPACSKASAITSTRSRANAVKISRSRVRAMWRNTGRASRRPPPSVSTTTAHASAELLPGEPGAGLARAEQRQDREHRDHGDVLEQQHRERALAALRGERAALGQRRERERGGGKRQRHGRD